MLPRSVGVVGLGRTLGAAIHGRGPDVHDSGLGSDPLDDRSPSVRTWSGRRPTVRCGCSPAWRCWSSWRPLAWCGCRPSGRSRYAAPQGSRAFPLGRWRSRCRWQRYAQSRWNLCRRGNRPSGTLRWPHSMRWGFSVPLARTSGIGSPPRWTAAERSWARCSLRVGAQRGAVRDAWLGWSTQQQQRFRYRVVANSRFLNRSGVRVPHLASHALALALRRASGQYTLTWAGRLSPCSPVQDAAPDATIAGWTQGRLYYRCGLPRSGRDPSTGTNDVAGYGIELGQRQGVGRSGAQLTAARGHPCRSGEEA